MGRRWLAQRHEDKYSVGIPDVSFIFDRVSGWLELKAASTLKEPLKLRKSQMVWMSSRERAGCPCLLMVGVGKEWVGIRVTDLVNKSIPSRANTFDLLGMGAVKSDDPFEVLKQLEIQNG